MMAQNVGLFRLVLEECDSAVDELGTASTWYRDSIQTFRQRRDSPSDNFEGETTLLNYLYCALLADDGAVVSEAAKIALNTDIDHYEGFSTLWRYHYMNALAAIILDTGTQAEQLANLEETLDDLDGSHAAFFGALWRALAGIEARDADQFTAGIDQLLDWHDGKVDFETKTDPKDLVCRQAAALLVVARRNGMDVHVDSEYIPECVSNIS